MHSIVICKLFKSVHIEQFYWTFQIWYAVCIWNYILFALCYATAKQSWRPSSASPSVKCFVRKSQANQGQFLGGKTTWPPYFQTIVLSFSKFKIFDFWILLFFWLIWFFIFVNIGPYGRKKSRDISSGSTQLIRSQTFLHTHWKGVYQRCSRNCEISKFRFFCIFCSFSLTWNHKEVNFGFFAFFLRIP